MRFVVGVMSIGLHGGLRVLCMWFVTVLEGLYLGLCFVGLFAGSDFRSSRIVGWYYEF